MSLLARNRDRLLTAQSNYNTSVSELPTQPSSAFVQGYDAVRGQVIVKTIEGDVFYCQSQTNGSMAIGNKVSLNLTQGGTPSVDGMP